MNKTGLSVRLIQYALLLLCFFSMNIFAEERKAFDFLSGLQQLGANFDQTEQELLPPDQAFKLTVRVRDENTLVAQFEPAKDYYLYRDKVAFKPQNSETSIEKISLPQGGSKKRFDFWPSRGFSQTVRGCDFPESGSIVNKHQIDSRCHLSGLQ